MPRHPFSAPGLAALTLALGLAAGAGASAAQEPAPAKAGVARPAESTVGEIKREIKEHENPDEPNILEPQPSLAVWTVVVFAGLFLVLRRFAWGPLLEALQKREEHLEHVLNETERARNESEKLLAEHRQRMAAAEGEVRTLIEGARKNAQAAYDETVRKAQAEAEASKQRAERDIASARDQALADIRTKAADLAVSVAGKVLGKTITGDDHRRLVEAATHELPAANGRGGQPS